MANPIQRFKERLKRKTSPSDAARTRARRRKAMMSNAATALPYVQCARPYAKPAIDKT